MHPSQQELLRRGSKEGVSLLSSKLSGRDESRVVSSVIYLEHPDQVALRDRIAKARDVLGLPDHEVDLGTANAQVALLNDMSSFIHLTEDQSDPSELIQNCHDFLNKFSSSKRNNTGVDPRKFRSQNGYTLNTVKDYLPYSLGTVFSLTLWVDRYHARTARCTITDLVDSLDLEEHWQVRCNI
jgi:hypothetical protein